MIPALLAALKGSFLTGLGGASAKSGISSSLVGTAGEAVLQELAPNLLKSFGQQSSQADPLVFESDEEMPYMQAPPLMDYVRPQMLNRPYQRRFKGLL